MDWLRRQRQPKQGGNAVSVAPVVSRPAVDKPDDPTGAKGILAAEFAYIAQTTVQNSEDRVSSFFFTSAGAVIAAVITLKIEANTPPWAFYAFGVVFFILAWLGLLAVLQLAELRSSWFDSIRAMNRIKQYYYARYPDAATFVPPPLPATTLPAETLASPDAPAKQPDPGVFLWMKEPHRFKTRSVAFLRCLSIATISGAFVVAGTVLFALGLNPGALQSGGTLGVAPLGWGIVLGLAVALVQVVWFRRRVSRDDNPPTKG